MSNPIYAVGDIHGQLGMLEGALERIEKDGGSDAKVVFLGDLVDRGPDSAGVIDLLLKGMAAGRNWSVVRGNHDRMYSYFLEDQPRPDPQVLLGFDWFNDRIGGKTTLASYGIDIPENARYFQIHPVARDVIPDAHQKFMADLPPYVLLEDLLFVHAGIRPEIPLDEQTEDDMCWIRHDFLNYTDPHPWLVVHGHTPGQSAVHMGNRINLDSGAGYNRPITAAVFEGRACWTLGDAGRTPLVP
ncbi:metallophosphoesterase family protein [Shimia sp. SDUM112013]|uniref:metallophosphoesterase family protein n=1 Tax=Shimia sp. SDUM112013 TaxID=3136160 RepID=UPI0032EF45F6